ncbi:MAG TPA: HAD hydrolase-like protein, partial [Bacteroidia bacterium]
IKYNLIAGKGNGHPFSQRFFVGDTETDIIAANELGLHSVGVLNGIRNYQQIKNASPKHIITGIHEFIKLIN